MQSEVKAHRTLPLIEASEVRDQCDGCGQRHPVLGLIPIGDGLIRVCRACYEVATATVLTKADTASSVKVK
jgi:hypothetical protein